MSRFAPGLLWRTALLTLGLLAMCYTWLTYRNPVLTGSLLLVNGSLFVFLLRYVTGLNRKLTRFLEGVQYNDFAVSFNADSNLGPSFRDLNGQFNAVVDAFRQARAENEANVHYLNTIVQHVSVGLLAFDAAGQVELSNPTALRLLGIYRLRNLADLANLHPHLPDLLRAGQPTVYRIGEQQDIALRTATVRLRGRLLTIASLQNIHSELQEKELDAWQNLTKVLRHEIMNSLTPIVSLTDTMQTIVADERANGTPDSAADALTDLTDALTTIGQRSRNLMQFVDGYRSFTALPAPVLRAVMADELLRRIVALVQPDSQQRGIRLTLTLPPQPIPVQADAGQIEMVVINLLKNAMEVLAHTPDPAIAIDAGLQDSRLVVTVTDNGPGISPDALETIFIPFYTTKKTGSGIGLSLSRQIMQRHGGTLTVNSSPDTGSTFRLGF